MPGPLPLTGTYPASPPLPAADRPPRRILAIWLMRLAFDRWRIAEGIAPGEGRDSAPLAMIVEGAHGLRIAAANVAGLAAGAQPGMMLADARTLCPRIEAIPADPAGDLAFLEKLALWSRRWGPWSALDAPDGLIVDVTGVAHLFGGEDLLLNDAREAFARRGLAARLALAPTAGAAWALAHYGADGAILPAANIAERLAPLPVAALRLDDDILTVLRRLGLKRLGDLSGVARHALMRRFRNRSAPAANPLIRLDQLTGLVPEPLLPVLPLEMPLVQRRLMEPIRHRALLDQVVADLAQDMARTLEAKALGARRLELGMWRVDGDVIVRALELASASRDPAHIAGLFGRKLDDVEAGFGIEMLRLRATWTESLALAQADLEASAETHGTSLSAFVDRLVARLGPAAVRRPAQRASHIPERAQGWEEGFLGAGESLLNASATSVASLRHRPDSPSQPPDNLQATCIGWLGGGVGLAPKLKADALSAPNKDSSRPIKLLDHAECISVLYASPDGLPRRFRWRGQVHEIARVEGPERIAPEWWRERSSVRLRDYYRIEDAQGRRYWIYRDGITGDGRGNDRLGGAPAWFLQGLWG